MTWPEPQPGLVIRYAYLWQREADAGREEGAKDRPCAIILALRSAAGKTAVYALPITHSPPSDPQDAIELPVPTKTRLGLDGDRSWIVITEVNIFAWPGPDLRRVPGESPQNDAYGMLPPALLNLVRDRFLARTRARRAAAVNRTE